MTALYWVITQLVVVISYRRFGISSRFHLQGQESKSVGFLTPEYGTIYQCTLNNIQGNFNLQQHRCDSMAHSDYSIRLNSCDFKYEKDTQCTCNVTPRRVRATNVAVEEKYVLRILSVCL